MRIQPAATEEEAAAIAAALELVWPKPAPASPVTAARVPAWRFSGRWWARPVAVRRDRPWWPG